MLDENEMVFPECHCCPDALSEIRMMKVTSSDVEEIPIYELVTQYSRNQHEKEYHRLFGIVIAER